MCGYKGDHLYVTLLTFRKKDGNITKGDDNGDGSEEIVAVEVKCLSPLGSEQRMFLKPSKKCNR